jgi:uncharacterized protein
MGAMVRRVLISGATGLIGSALEKALLPQSVEVVKLVRRASQKANELPWDSVAALPAQCISGFDAVIHLSGESVMGRWTEKKKRAIRESRVLSTQNLATALAETEVKPSVFVCASAIGFYGNRNDEVLDEESAPGQGFLSSVCREWEGCSRIAANAGIRTINLRTGLVLSSEGGALAQMLRPFRLGLGGRIGSGRQWWSWIHIQDVVGAIRHAMMTPSVAGPVNLVAPKTVRNREFTEVLASVLKRPAIFPVPQFALNLAFGKLAAEEMLLSSQRAAPQKLEASGYAFYFRELRPALEDLTR